MLLTTLSFIIIFSLHTKVYILHGLCFFCTRCVSSMLNGVELLADSKSANVRYVS